MKSPCFDEYILPNIEQFDIAFEKHQKYFKMHQ